VLILVNFSERNLCPMNVCDTCDDRSRGDLSKNAVKPVQNLRTGPRNRDVRVRRAATSVTRALIAGK
jgi:hypothetical protein